jgi:response regulator RpfG family c-di-GMP phosphodiesterase
MLNFNNNQFGELHIRSMSLLSFLILLLFNGCSNKNTKGDPYMGENALAEQKSLIEKNISDPIKQRQLMQVVSDYEIALKEFDKKQARHYQNMKALTADYNATQKDFEDLIDDFNIEYEMLLKYLVARRMEMKALVTPEEWKTISGERKTSILSN